MKKVLSLILLCVCAAVFSSTVCDAAAPTLELIGPRRVCVQTENGVATFEIDPAERIEVANEKIVPPVYNEQGAMYRRGAILSGVRAEECSVCGAIEIDSVVVRDAPDGKTFENGTDYKVDAWGAIGRCEGGKIGENQPVFVSYSFVKMRLDSIVRGDDNKITIRKGESHVATPPLATLDSGETRLANVWIHATTLTDDDLFPIIEREYTPPHKTGAPVAAKLTPKTFEKLQRGERVHILAWGDSVTDASYLADTNEKWQSQFVARLREAFPKADIVLTSEAWGGRNTSSYLAEPPGSQHNYKEKVLDAKPDLVVMEFVNDAWMNEQAVFEQYTKLLDDFRSIGAEWIILTPHYVRPDWMNLAAIRGSDDDPRPYVHAIRKFGEEKGVAIADGAKRYGHLWREGIPYLTLMGNNINHPNGFGMSLFAAALMELFTANTNASDAGDEPIRVLTFNVRYSHANDGENAWPRRRDFLAEVIEKPESLVAYDFVGLQEAVTDTDSEFDQVGFLKAKLTGYDVLFESRETNPKRGETTALFWKRDRWEIDRNDCGTFWLSDTPDVAGSKTWAGAGCPRTVTFGKFTDSKSGRQVYVYNTHFDHMSEDARKRAAHMLMSRIAARRDTEVPVIVTGDFNNVETSPAIRFIVAGDAMKLTDADTKDVCNTSPLCDTFRAVHPGADAKDIGTTTDFRKAGQSKIDYIFASPSLKTVSSEIVRTKRDGKFPSDHLPLEAVIGW
ncbi:MAG: endonuclease/exonuclease/phosphatase family protein [Thermoguttaceae bacterium]